MSTPLFCRDTQKIALLFLTYSDLNQTEIWKEWIDPSLYNVYNHSKTPSLDPWFSQYRIQEILQLIQKY